MWVYDLQINFSNTPSDSEYCEIIVNRNTIYYVTGARNFAIIRSIQSTKKEYWKLSLVTFVNRNCYKKEQYIEPDKKAALEAVESILKSLTQKDDK